MIIVDKVKNFILSASNKSWVISTVAVIQYFWSFAFSINFFISFLDFFSGNDVSQRNLFIFILLFFLLIFILVFTSDVRWKAFLKIFFYTLGLVSALLILAFVSLLFKHFFIAGSDIDLVFTMLCFVVGVVGYFVSYKALKSEYFG